MCFSQRVCNACIPKVQAADNGGVDQLNIDVQMWLRQQVWHALAQVAAISTLVSAHVTLITARLQSELLPSAALALIGARGPPSKTFFMWVQPRFAQPLTSRALCMCQNASGEEFVVSWVQRGSCSVLPKKRSGCLAFQQLMTQLEHPYIMPCIAAACVAHSRRLSSPASCACCRFDADKDVAAIVRPAVRQVTAENIISCHARAAAIAPPNV